MNDYANPSDPMKFWYDSITEIETALIGGVILHPEAVGSVIQTGLETEHFGDLGCAALWTRISGIISRGGTIDHRTVLQGGAGQSKPVDQHRRRFGGRLGWVFAGCAGEQLQQVQAAAFVATFAGKIWPGFHVDRNSLSASAGKAGFQQVADQLLCNGGKRFTAPAALATRATP